MRKIALGFLFLCISVSLSKEKVFAGDPAPIIETSQVYQTRDGKSCSFFNGCVEAGTDATVNLSGLAYNNGLPFPDGANVKVRINGSSGCSDWPEIGYTEAVVTNGSANLTIPGSEIKGGCSYEFIVHLSNDYDGQNGGENNTVVVASSTMVQAQCAAEECNENLDSTSNYELCAQIKTGTPQYEACATCFNGNGIWTAIGCIPSKPDEVIKVVITIGLALGGGVVLIMILVGAFMLSVSQGDPNKTKEAKETITSAIIGLLFVIFSVTILQFIGVSILHIPGFGE